MNTHFFFALVLPDSIKRHLHTQTDELKSTFPFKKWLHPADYHITMAFLGNAEATMKEEALELIKHSLANEQAFELDIDGIDVFGKKESPRILWAGVKQEERLNAIQKKIYESCKQAGFELDKKPFKPHITLARKFEGEPTFSINKVRQLVNPEEKRFQASQIALYQTHLGASPSYEPVYTINLK
ncbi:RNA 2',3'-cyclic phosphodiesterase [Peribacillus sp. NPDC097675]|uniref:RNA 2',3'-cyclic phosphodiesterase n=1 Tax=Peribacillus sp. NPDC097675 TaxID=3390618 RepID=UPI003D028751